MSATPSRLRQSVGPVVVTLLVALLAGACAAAPAATPPPTAVPSSSAAASTSPSGPSASPTFAPDAVVHPTGAAEVVLRYDVAGGFVPVEFSVGHLPQFTLYGDGRVIFPGASDVSGVPADGVATGGRLRTVMLTEPQVQDLLKFALLEGGLGVATGPYDATGVADAPTATFEIHADGNDKTVSAYALGIDATGADLPMRARLSRLADRLSAMESGGAAGAPWEPVAYRAMLLDASGVTGVKVRAWPWNDVAQAAFRTDPAANGMPIRKRVLTPAQAQAIGVTGFEGGILSGFYVRLDDGTVATLAVRPLLPDETS
jgi:hypothetical protein